jgi:serine/threonine-protein kinase 24/25/MST4
MADKHPFAVKVTNADAGELDAALEASMMDYCKHANIVRLEEAFVNSHGQVCLVMEWMSAGSLENYVGREGWTEARIVYVLREAGKGLAHMHARSIFHLDVKSDNVLLHPDGGVKLGDFGFALGLATDLADRKGRGTPNWMAPEVISELDFDGRADVWSLGIVALELAHGATPHSEVELGIDAFFRLILDSPSPALEEGWSTEFREFVQFALCKDPEFRATMQELLDDELMLSACSQDEFAQFLKAPGPQQAAPETKTTAGE